MLRIAALLCGAAACDATFSLIRVDDPVDGDIEDGLTTCWKPSETFDEDSDGIVDGCDLCPADPMASLIDPDGDGVDDVCDPHRSAPNDVVVDFDGFMTKRSWQPIAGTWSITGGTLSTQTDTLIASTELETALADRPALDAIFDGNAGIGIYMLVGAAKSPVTCEHVIGSSPTPDRLTLKLGSSVAQMQDFDVGGGPGRITLSMDLLGGFMCRVERGAQNASVAATQGAAGTATSRIGVISRNGVTSFSSVTLFGVLR